MTRALTLLGLLLATAVACDSDDAGDSGADSAEDTSTETGEPVDDPLDFPPVECGEMTCAEGLICVMPGEYCNYNLDPPAWVQPPFECAPAPVSCTGLTDYQLRDCLWETLCEAMGETEYEPVTFLEGTLDCPTIGLDCFE